MGNLFWMIFLSLMIRIFTLNAGMVSEEDIEKHPSINTLFTVQIDLPQTFLENILSLEEAKRPWYDTTYYRETINFGKDFPALEEGRVIERPIPDFIAEVRDQLFQIFKKEIKDDLTPEDYDNCIITIYKSWDGIAPHIDRNLEWANRDESRKYYFGESIIGLIVEPDSEQSLFFQNPNLGETSRFYLEEKQGTAFLFQDSLRNEWEHGLLPVAKGRISITFRHVILKNKG